MLPTSRHIAVLVNPSHDGAWEAAAAFTRDLDVAGIIVHTYDEDVSRMCDLSNASVRELNGPCELAVVFGGDGSILRAAEWAMPQQTPLLGVNLGHVGFLAELETSDLDELFAHVLAGEYRIERRLSLKVTVRTGATDGDVVWESFAVNELSVEKAARERMIEVLASVNGRPVSLWGCDGVLVSTPTGSTAYAFSAGGPIMWPELDAFQVVPLSAHALFARPLVLGPNARIDLQLSADSDAAAVAWCDGRRSVTMTPGQIASVERGPHQLLLARLTEQPFSTRLVKKFRLPVRGWRRPELGG